MYVCVSPRRWQFDAVRMQERERERDIEMRERGVRCRVIDTAMSSGAKVVARRPIVVRSPLTSIDRLIVLHLRP